MGARSRTKGAVVLPLVALAAALLLVARAAKAPTTRAHASQVSLRATLGTTLLFDFDGDNQLDYAELVSDNGPYRGIDLHLSGSWTKHLWFNAQTSAPGVLLVRDLDQDCDLDVAYVVSARLSASVIWLGDGHGNFERVQNAGFYFPQLHSLLDSIAGVRLDEATRLEEAAYALGPSSAIGLALGDQLAISTSAPASASGKGRRRDLGGPSSSLHERGPPSTHL